MFSYKYTHRASDSVLSILPVLVLPFEKERKKNTKSAGQRGRRLDSFVGRRKSHKTISALLFAEEKRNSLRSNALRIV